MSGEDAANLAKDVAARSQLGITEADCHALRWAVAELKWFWNVHDRKHGHLILLQLEDLARLLPPLEPPEIRVHTVNCPEDAYVADA
jgi:hypothetical protein